MARIDAPGKLAKGLAVSFKPANLNKIAAGIVAFNPDIDLLKLNVAAISGQVSKVYVFDNGSQNFGDISSSLMAFRRVELIPGGSNLGVAAALNRLALVAIRDGFDWLVTLDQDSIAGIDMVSILRAKADAETPLVTPYIVDRNKISLDDFEVLDLPEVHQFERAASKGAITSGALLNLDVLVEVGGFDERFFIDYVDYDLNAQLLKRGYRIVRANRAYLSHEVGEAIKTWLVTPRRSIEGRWAVESFYSFGHSPFRCYYKARNRVLYSRKHWRFIKLRNEGVIQIPQQIVLTILFEKDKLEKLKAFARGTRDGLRLAMSRDVMRAVPWPPQSREWR